MKCLPFERQALELEPRGSLIIKSILTAAASDCLLLAGTKLQIKIIEGLAASVLSNDLYSLR